MRHVSFGRHRGADWLSRSAFPVDARGPAYERFVLRLHDPNHPRALWVCLSLARNAGVAEAQCSAIYFDAASKTVQVAQESWPLERVAIDPERGGLGVGECQLLAEHGQGLVRGAGFALSWDVALRRDVPAQSLLPKSWLYRHRRLRHKASAPLPAARVKSGRIEIWHELGRHAKRTALDASGWRASISHSWGEGPLSCYAEAHAHTLEGAFDGAYLHATAGRTQLLGAVQLDPQLGVLQLDGAPEAFAGWRALRGNGPAHVEAHRWRMELLGEGATFVGEVHSDPALTAQVPGPFGGSFYVSELATLEATYTPRAAAARTVHGKQVSFEAFVP